MTDLLNKKFRITWLICLLLVITFSLTSISSYIVTRGNVRETIRDTTLPLTSDNVYSEIQRDLLQPIYIASLMANDTFLRDWALQGEKDESAITRYLKEIKTEYGTVSSFFVSEATRKYYHPEGELKVIKEDAPADAWYFRVRDMKAPYEINVDQDAANANEMTIFINYKTYDFDGNFIGATGVGLTVNSVNTLIHHYEAKFDRHIYFIDQYGSIMLRTDNSPLSIHESIDEIEGLTPHAQKLKSHSNTHKINYNRDGQKRMLNSRYVPELNWHLIVEQSESASLASIKGQLIMNLTLSTFITIIVAFACIQTIRSHERELKAQNAQLTLSNQEKEAQAVHLHTTAQQLEAANKEKDEFISILAHDLKNPLNAIIGFSEMAQIDDSDIELKSYARNIEACGERMLALTQKLLEVSQIESFQGEIVTEAVNWNDIISRSASHFTHDATRKNIAIHLDLEHTENVTIQTNPDWLELCLNNLISNAVKYSPQYARVDIRTHHRETHIEVEIQDNGSGISENDQKKMFQKFVRLSAQPTGNESSTGLGLYIVKKMCQHLGIEIKVKSTLGSGTKMILIQPLDSLPA